MSKIDRSKKLIELFISLQAQADRYHMSNVPLQKFIEQPDEIAASERILETFDALQLESELI